MKNKNQMLIIPALIIGVVSGYYLNRPAMNFDKANQLNSVTPSPKLIEDKVVEKNTKNTIKKQSKNSLHTRKVVTKFSLSEALSNPKDSYIQAIIESDKVDKNKIFGLINNELGKSLNCLSNGSCIVSDENKGFIDIKTQEQVYKIENILSLMSHITLDRPELLNDIPDANLLSIMDIQSKDSFRLANLLLSNKGEDHFEKTLNFAKSYKGVLASEYVKAAYNQTDRRLIEKVESVISTYLRSDDQHTLSEVLDTLDKINLEDKTIIGYVESACSGVIKNDSETHRIIRSNIDKLARKARYQASCTI